jgi:hypothetical protein
MRVLRFMEQMLPATAAGGAVFAIHAGVGGCGLGRQPAPSVGLGQGLQSQSQATRCATSSNSNLRRGQGNYSLGRGAGEGPRRPASAQNRTHLTAPQWHCPWCVTSAIPMRVSGVGSRCASGLMSGSFVQCAVLSCPGGRSRNVKLAMMGAECQRYSVPARTTGPDWRLSWSIEVNQSIN